MSAYVFGADVGMARSASTAITVSLSGIPAGALILFKTSTSATNSTVAPTNLTWVQLSQVSSGPGSGSSDSILFGRIATGSETTETFTWAAGFAAGDVGYFTGGVYTDLTTIAVAVASRQATNASLVNFSASTITPTVDNCLVVCGGRKLRSNSTSATFGAVNVGSFTELSFQPVGAVSFAQACVWNYEIQTTATAVGPAAQIWSTADGTAQNEQGWIVALQPATTQPIAGGAAIGVAASGNLDAHLSGTAATSVNAAAALSTAIKLAGSASVSAAVSAALTNWATVTLAGTLYTGTGGILDPNFWVSVVPTVGTTIFYDATKITVYANGEISSTTNNCSAVVQFFDGTAWSIGLVVITPNFVTYANIVAAGAGALSTAIQMAGAAISSAQVSGNLHTAIMLASVAVAQANAAGSLLTAIQMNSAALASVSASGALTGGVSSLQGNANVLMSALGALSTAIETSGQVLVNSQMTGALTASIGFQGVATALAQVNGQLTTAIQLVGNASVVSTAAGAALISSAFSGAASIVTSALGALLVGVQFGGNALVAVSASGDLSTGISLAGAAEVDTAAQLALPGPEGAFGYGVITVLSLTGLPVAKSVFPANSACIATISYFNVLGNPFTPSAVTYQVDDVLSGENLVPPTSISPLALSSSVTITAAQNSMVSLSRDFEDHQILFLVTDGQGNTWPQPMTYGLVRIVGVSA